MFELPNPRASIIIVGDAMIDRYYDGSASRISPEAPVPVLRVERVREVPGGAANVALNIAALGGAVTLIAYVGDDDDARCLRRLLEAAGVRCCFQTAARGRTIVKLRALSRQQQMLRLDFEDDFAAEDHAALIKTLKEHVIGASVLVLSDYGKGTLSAVDEIIALAGKAGVRTVVDPKGRDFARYRGAYVITPNEGEFRLAAQYFFEDGDAALEERARNFRKEIQVDNLLVTRGERGMMYVGSNGESRFISTEAKEVFDVTGAGDTVVGVLALALASDVALAEAMSLANRAAGIVVGRHGTATVTTKELFAVVDAPGDVLDEIELAKRAGERIVMTNGCFDVIHAGHVTYLEEARKLGDRLVVALNTDASVARLKGSSRPINSFEHRSSVLAALRAVDWVIGFGDENGVDRDTPRQVITLVKPDVLVKGADYTVDQIVGAREVLASGGEVRTIDLVAGLSTSELLRRQQLTSSGSIANEGACS